MAQTYPPKPTYTDGQLEQYFGYINLPQSLRGHPVLHDRSIAGTKDGLDFLSALVKYQLAAVPFENLDIHYSKDHTCTLDVQELYHKIVERRAGRGGYCMQNNAFFGTVLHSVGYDLYSTGARVARQGLGGDDSSHLVYEGFSHMVNIVTIEGARYAVDVGFGGAGSPQFPVPLEEGRVHINGAPQTLRLVRAPLPQMSNKTQSVWLNQHRVGDRDVWKTAYSFVDVEFVATDYEIANWWCSTSPDSWFTRQIVCSKFILQDEDIVGQWVLFEREVKQRLGSESRVVVKCESEEDRVRALADYLGVTLSQDEVKGIRGCVSEIKQ